MAGDDDFDLTRYVLQLSRKIAQLTKDYVGLPFSNSSQLPFSIDARPPRSKFYGTTKKWKRGDPLIGFYSPEPGQKKMILNMPDGSTMLDMCYPGWEIAIIDEPALDHFLSRRYLFGDYYHHMLTSRPLRQVPPSDSKPHAGKDDIEAAMARQAEIFKKRRTSLQKAAEDQQRRGVPFDEHPSAHQARDITPGSAPLSHEIAVQAEHNISESASPRVLRRIAVASQSIRDGSTGTSRNRLVIQKTYSTGETETIEKSQQGQVTGELDCNVEELLASQLFNVFVVPSAVSDRESSTKDVDVVDKDA